MTQVVRMASAPPAGREDAAIVGRHLTKVYGLGARQAAEVLRAPDPAAQAARRGGHLAAHDVSFSIARGEMFVVMGLSGSGKSTVLRMLNRLNEPTAGELIVDGEDIRHLSDGRLRELRNRSIGMVFQHFSLFPHRTVRDNAAYGLKVRGVPRREREERAEAALARVGLGGRGDRFPHELSGGMRQRVGLARALATDPPILLMDEPFSALDPLIRRDMQDLLVQLQAEDGRTVVFVTHDLNEAMRIGDRVMVMREGRVVQIGSGVDIVSRPADDYVSEFVSDVDRTRVLTAGDLARPALVTLPASTEPAAALRLLGEREVTGAFVVAPDGVVLGIVTDTDLLAAARSGATSVTAALSQDFHAVAPGTVVAEFVHLAGRHVVPVTVVDEQRRLLGVVPRASILASLSSAKETVDA